MAVRKDKRNGTWMYDGKYKDKFTDKYKSYRKSGFKTKRDAQYEEQKFLDSLNGSSVMTLDALVDMCVKNDITSKNSTMIAYASTYRCTIQRYLGKTKISDITSKSISDMMISLANEGYSASYVNYIKTILSKYLNYAVSNDLIEINQCRRVKNYKNADVVIEEKKFWTKEQFEQFIGVVDIQDYRDLFTTLYLTGMRKGELCALNWNDIDFKSRKININKTINVYHVITSPKTKNSYRKIDMQESLYKLLYERFKRESMKDGFTYNWFVFGSYRYFPFGNIRNRLIGYCNKANLEPINPHAFRHTHASLLIKSGKFSVNLIAERLGDNVDTVLNTYAHVYEEMRKNMANELENIL